MSENFKLAIDKQTNAPLSIENVESGSKCNAKCADCGADFIAAKGEKNKWHFRHSVESDCKGGQETALHKLAKEIICRNLEMQITKSFRLHYTKPISELNQDDFRPDVTAQYGNEKLYFEVVVHNPLSPRKANDYISNETKTIILDLSKYEYQTEVELEKYIIQDITSKKVLFWVKEKPLSFWSLMTILGIVGVLLYGFYKFTKNIESSNSKPLNKARLKPKLKQVK